MGKLKFPIPILWEFWGLFLLLPTILKDVGKLKFFFLDWGQVEVLNREINLRKQRVKTVQIGHWRWAQDACWAHELQAIETGTKFKVNGHRVEPYLEPFKGEDKEASVAP